MATSFVLRKRDGTPLADITSISYGKRVRVALSRPRMVSFRVPSDSDLIWTLADDGLPYLCTGYRQILVTLDTVGLYANCIVWALEDEGDEDMAYTRVTCWDPMMIWPKRPARDPDGDFTDPTFMKDNMTGPAILQAILDASENAGIGPPDDAEGDLFVDITTGNWPGGGVDLSAAPTNFPMYIGTIAGLLMSSGQLDVRVVPTDNGAEMGRVDTYNGNWGTNLTGSVHLDYATGDFNASTLHRTEDMTDTANKIWRYLGSRQDLQHWRANVTGDDPFLPGNSLNGVGTPGGPGIGGALPTRPNYGIAGPPQLGDLIQASRDGIGVLMEFQIADDQGGEDSVRPLQRRIWQMESLFRVNPRRQVFLTPARAGLGISNPVELGDFNEGDLIAINVGTRAREAVTNMVQRIYAFTVDIDDDGVYGLGELECSPDLDQL
jgi:hypothetical protein